MARRYPYCEVVVGLEWSNDPESYAGGSTDRSKVMTQTKRDTLALQVGGLGVVLTTPPHKIKVL
jgi:hypothetical protein